MLFEDLSKNNKNVKSPPVEIINKKSKKFTVSGNYRPPNEEEKAFNTNLRGLYSKLLASERLYM